MRTNAAAVVQVRDEHDSGIDAAAHEALFDDVALILMQSHCDSREGSPETRQNRGQKVSRYGVADGNIDGTVNLGAPAMRRSHGVSDARLDGAGPLQKQLAIECQCDP